MEETGLRSSDRLKRKPNADAPQMEKAMSLAESRDLLWGSGTTSKPKLSFTSLPNEVIKGCVHRHDAEAGTPFSKKT